MKVKVFKPDTYFSRKVDLEMAMADAIYYGEKKLVRDYINTGRVDINRPGKAGFTFLMYAVYIEQYDVAKVLLENGADPNILSIVTHPDGAVERLTPLSCVCAHHWYPIKYIKLLVENGANINDTITAPFIRCITYSIKDQKKVRYMIEHGANINIVIGDFSPIPGMYNGEIITYTLPRSPNLKMVTDMLKMAFKKYKGLGGLLLHSDQGWHFQHTQYQNMLKNNGIILSMSPKGNCLDNSLSEHFFGLVKNELLYVNHFESLDEIESELKKYIV